MAAHKKGDGNDRTDLDQFRLDNTNRDLTTNQGVPIADNQNSLRASERGPTLLEDFILREKITHFDHERIPERVVHARGSGAHGYFELYESLEEYTRAGFLTDTSKKTPVFARFSTVGGSRGSADTARDVRGFAVKFYTDEGNYDLVGNNMPVFFIQDAIKFPDFVHAVKPEPANEIPQASSAHDTFYDFVSLTPEATHMVLWLMSDRAIPKSLRTMEGFGVHTFRFINAAGKATYVKFHWKPVLGAHSLVWNESQKLMGFDPDFHRRDLWEAIEQGNFPAFELGVQMFDDAQADAFDFDILDPTKLIPEELVPVRLIGKMTLNQNPNNFFAETEQVAFCVSHVVPGIDFTNDPLLQGRIFSYLDTQISRLGGPNFHQIPINRPRCPFHNGQADGMHQMGIPTNQTSYDPNSIDGGWPKEKPVERGGFASYLEHLEGDKRRVRAGSFKDHFSQAKLFYNSQSPAEQTHIAEAFSFELAKVTRPEIRTRFLSVLAHVDTDLVATIAAKLGMPAPAPAAAPDSSAAHTNGAKRHVDTSPLLSLQNPATGKPGTATRKVAILAADGIDGAAIAAMKTALEAAGAKGLVLAPHLGTVEAAVGAGVTVDHTIETMPSVAFDALFVPGGAEGIGRLTADGDAVHFVAEAYRHCKAIAVLGDGAALLEAAAIRGDGSPGLIVSPDGGVDQIASLFVAALGQHRAWDRADRKAVPA